VTEPRTAPPLPHGAVVIVSRLTEADAVPRGEPGWGPYLHYGLIRRFHREGYGTLVIPPEPFGARADHAEAPGIAGVVAFPDTLGKESALARLRRLRDAGTPVAVGDPAETQEFDVVRSDHESGSYQATAWLIEHGCRRILRWWALAQHTRQRPAWLDARDAGYERALREAGLDPLQPVEFRFLGSRAGQTPAETLPDNIRLTAGYLAERLADNPAIDALLLSTDGEVRSVVPALGLCGRDYGRDVLLAGYDNYWAEPQARPTPPVAPTITVDKNNQQIGEALAELLLERAAGTLPPEPQRRWIEPKLIVLSEACLAQPTDSPHGEKRA